MAQKQFENNPQLDSFFQPPSQQLCSEPPVSVLFNQEQIKYPKLSLILSEINQVAFGLKKPNNIQVIQQQKQLPKKQRKNLILKQKEQFHQSQKIRNLSKRKISISIKKNKQSNNLSNKKISHYCKCKAKSCKKSKCSCRNKGIKCKNGCKCIPKDKINNTCNNPYNRISQNIKLISNSKKIKKIQIIIKDDQIKNDKEIENIISKNQPELEQNSYFQSLSNQLQEQKQQNQYPSNQLKKQYSENQSLSNQLISLPPFYENEQISESLLRTREEIWRELNQREEALRWREETLRQETLKDCQREEILHQRQEIFRQREEIRREKTKRRDRCWRRLRALMDTFIVCRQGFT